jgi:hypothetical protein
VTATYRDMVRSLSTRSYCDGNADDAEEHEDECPPGIVGEADIVA